MTIIEALEAAKRDPGRVYCCEEQGELVEVRVVPQTSGNGSDATPPRRLLTKELCEEDIMLDAWCELPGPKPIFRVKAKPGPRLMPDIPEIPRDEEDAV